MTIMAEAQGRPAAVEVEHKPSEVEHLITAIEQRLTGLMATGGTHHERYDGAQRVFTYTWPSFEPGHNWSARRVLTMTAPAGEEWATHTRVRLRKPDAAQVVAAEYGLNGNHLSRIRPDKATDLPDSDQVAALRTMRASLDRHIVDSGYAPYFADLVDDPVIDASPEQWAEWDAVRQQAIDERAAMVERHGATAQTAELRASGTVLHRLQLMTELSGRQGRANVNDDDVPYVQTFLGYDEARRMYYTIHNDAEVGEVGDRVPDMLVVGDEYGTQIYMVSAEGVVSKQLRNGDDAMQERVQLHERVGNLNKHLQQLALEASKQDLPLHLRIPLLFEGENAADNLHFVHVPNADYDLGIFNLPRSDHYSIYVLDKDKEAKSEPRVLEVPKDKNKPVTMALMARHTPQDLQDLEDLVANGIDKHLGIKVEPDNEYEAALWMTEGLFEDNNIPYQSMAIDHGTSPVHRSTLIRGHEQFDEFGTPYGNLTAYHIEQLGTLGYDGQTSSPLTRVTVSVVDSDNRDKITRQVTYTLSQDGFEPQNAKGRAKAVAKQAAKDFESFARNLLADKY